MIDFRSALQAGLSSAKKIDLNKKEIEQKLRNISDMISEVTLDKVALVFDEYPSHRASMLGDRVDSIFVVSQVDKGKGSRIGTIIRNSENGFPVIIEVDHSKFVCGTVDEIEQAFSEVVQINFVANAIFSLISEG
ncbi:hypothetical protein C1882_13575 [Pseudomonas sp. FW305-E2]|uniref:hypothetical protein n=1 Tax=Pseudomonas sp. FW305-E2 TaxID=2075558 RepID=UPI000B4F1412|nr:MULTISPECIES: hypothetical protein [Pseudomonas]POA85018.1 hypothetical protein C1882_13575 [Pseudomonas sp. FW305-E2]